MSKASRPSTATAISQSISLRYASSNSTFVGLSSAGYAQPLVAGDPFMGIAYEEADNTTGANAAVSVRVYTLGDFGHALAGASESDERLISELADLWFHSYVLLAARGLDPATVEDELRRRER